MTVMSEEEKREYIKTACDNLFVEAGAGAGKTTMLSDRIVNQIASGEPMRSFVVITFTKAAAQELLERIVMTLRKRMDHAEGEELEVLQNAMQRIDELHVSTIHSFCRTILMEYAFDAGFVLDPVMLEEDEEEERMDSFFRLWKQKHWKEVRELADVGEHGWYLPLNAAFHAAAKVRCPIVLDELPAEEQTPAERFMHTAVRIAKDYQEYIDSDSASMTNDQLLYKAGKLVKENDVICEKLRRKYRHLYVDEFQDTDDIQADMIWKLAEKEPGVLRDNALFVVGDPKQSIYRFRGAQVELFYDIRQKMEDAENATVLSLEANFRSDQSIIKYVNTSFARTIADYTPMRTNRCGTSPYTGVFSCSYTVAGENGKPIKNDIQAVCDLVETMVAVNKDTHYGDFLIITKDKGKIADYVNGFSDKGIATAVRGKIDVAGSEILSGFVHAYRSLADRDAKMDRAQHAQLLSGREYGDLELEEKGARLEELRTFAKETGFYLLSAEGAARVLYEHPELYVPRGREITKTELRSGKAKLLQCIDTCIAQKPGGRKELADLMTEYRSEEIPREIPLCADEDAVAIMNVHQCKGLAGKIVIIADRRQTLNDDKCDTLLMDGKCYPVYSYKTGLFSSELMNTYARHDELVELNLQKRQEEWVRLEYVAATRARECMIFMNSQKDGSWFSSDAYDVERLPDIMDVINELRKAPEEEKEKGTDIEDADLHAVMGLDRSSVEGIRRSTVSPSSLESSGVSGYASGSDGYVKEDRPASELFGTVLHRAFELLVNRRDSWLNRDTDSAVRRAAAQALNENSEEIPEEDLSFWEDFLVERLNAYCTKVLPGLLKDTKEVHTEYPFSLVLHEGEERPAFLQDAKYSGELTITGTMDLLLVYNDGRVKIVDYKSDAKNGMSSDLFRERMQKKYRNQIALYAFALKKARGFDKVETEFMDLYRCQEGKYA